MPTEAEFFKALSVENRIRIIELLKRRGVCCVNAITRELGITQSAVSQHLRLLRQLNLLKSERKGYWIHYRINEEKLERCRLILDRVCRCGCLSRLTNQPMRKDKKELKRYKARLEKELRAVNRALAEFQ